MEEGLSTTTLRDLKSTIGTFAKRTGATRLEDITLKLLREFFYEGKERYQWSYYRYDNYRKYLKKFVTWCVRQGYRASNPVELIQKQKKPARLPRRLTEEQARRILLSAFSYPWRYPLERSRNYAIIATFLHTGIRRGELLRLRIDDIDLESSTIFIRREKGNKDRFVPIVTKLRPALNNYLRERQTTGKICPSAFVGARQDRPFRERGLKMVCKKISSHSGVQFTPHQLRHTLASVAVEKDVKIAKLQRILGHRDIHSTMIYLSMSSSSLRKSLEATDMF